MDEQSRWMTQLLEASLQSSGLSGREVEERLGWEPGAVGRMLDGSAECGPRELLAILAELGSERAGNPVPPQRRERGTQMVRELIERFNALGYGQPGAARVASPPPAAGEIEKTVEDVLQRTFGDLGKGRRGGE
jgi:hypothetical protein